MYWPIQSIQRRADMKKITGICLSLALVIGISLVPSAEVSANEVEVAVDGTLLTHQLESTMEALTMTRGIYLGSCSASVTSPGTGYVCGTGKTYATMVIPSIYVDVAIQRYNGSGWTTVASWVQYAYNAAYVGSSKTYSVTRGYYYRTATVHNAYGEYGSACTNGIYIS